MPIARNHVVYPNLTRCGLPLRSMFIFAVSSNATDPDIFNVGDIFMGTQTLGVGGLKERSHELLDLCVSERKCGGPLPVIQLERAPAEWAWATTRKLVGSCNPSSEPSPG